MPGKHNAMVRKILLGPSCTMVLEEKKDGEEDGGGPTYIGRAKIYSWFSHDDLLRTCTVYLGRRCLAGCEEKDSNCQEFITNKYHSTFAI